MPRQVTELRLDLTPDPSTLYKTGRSNFSLAFALGEFVDNAYDAAFEYPVVVDIMTNRQERSITVVDQASGMTREDLQRALRIGSPPLRGDGIGEFGFGLKAAATYLADNFTIQTTPANGDYSIQVSFERDSFRTWDQTASILEPPLEDLPRGTRLILESVNVGLDKPDVERASKAISQVFRRLITARKLVVKVNGTELIPLAYKLIPEVRFTIKETVNEKQVTGWVSSFLPDAFDPDEKAIPGLQLFRKDRLVKEGEWIGISYHARHRTLFGEVNLEDFAVNTNKTDFLRDTPDWLGLERKLTHFFKRKAISQRIYEAIRVKPKPEASVDETGGTDDTPQPEPETEPKAAPSSPGTPGGAVKPQEVDRPTDDTKPTEAAGESDTARVFVVHGLDHGARDTCVAILEEFGITAVVLDKAPEPTLQSLLQKFEAQARRIDYAIVIMTPDDRAFTPSRGEVADQARWQPRQNVMFEFGYFVKSLHRRVMCLCKEGCGLVWPSDVEGAVRVGWTGDVREAKERIRANLVAAGVLRP